MSFRLAYHDWRASSSRRIRSYSGAAHSFGTRDNRPIFSETPEDLPVQIRPHQELAAEQLQLFESTNNPYCAQLYMYHLFMIEAGDDSP